MFTKFAPAHRRLFGHRGGGLRELHEQLGPLSTNSRQSHLIFLSFVLVSFAADDSAWDMFRIEDKGRVFLSFVRRADHEKLKAEDCPLFARVSWSYRPARTGFPLEGFRIAQVELEDRLEKKIQAADLGFQFFRRFGAGHWTSCYYVKSREAFEAAVHEAAKTSSQLPPAITFKEEATWSTWNGLRKKDG